MPQNLPIFPEQPKHEYTITLDGEQFQFVLTYRDRRASWYLDLSTADGTALVRGRRCSPGYPLVFPGTVGSPKGLLTCDAPADPYQRDELRLLYYTAEELAQ